MAVLRRLHPLLLGLLVVGLLAALVTLWLRRTTEGAARRVALVLDYPQVRALAVATGTTAADLLLEFRRAGATGVAISEQTLGDVEQSGELQVRLQVTGGNREARLRFADPVTAGRAADAVGRHVASASSTRPTDDCLSILRANGKRLYLPGRWDDYRGFSLGLAPDALRDAAIAGLEPVVRVSNSLGLTAALAISSLRQARAAGSRVVIFSGDEVLGYRGLQSLVAAAFREQDLLFGSIEFGKQRGDETLAAALVDRLIRVHSISSAEMARMKPVEAIERYVRAAEERNMRLLYVRLPGGAMPDPRGECVAYVHELAREVARAGFGLASPAPFGRVWNDARAGRAAGIFLAFGVAGSVAVLLALTLPLGNSVQAWLGVVLALGCGALAATGATLATQVLALLAAIVFPTLALVAMPLPLGAYENHHPAAPRAGAIGIPAVLMEFLARTAVTAIGAVLVAAILSELPFLVKTRSFSGVKLATTVPILLTAAYYALGPSCAYENLATEWEAIYERVRRFLLQPFLVWHVMVVGAAGAVLLLLVLRSGNDAGIGVSEWELRFRSLLDRVLYVRPRTKEFLLGHPALFMALVLAAVPRARTWALLLLVLGAVGQVGLLNSFCHLHSPLKLTVIRTFNGLWTGILVGGAVWALWALLARPRRNRRRIIP